MVKDRFIFHVHLLWEMAMNRGHVNGVYLSKYLVSCPVIIGGVLLLLLLKFRNIRIVLFHS